MKPTLRPLIIGAGGVASYLLPALNRTFDIQKGMLLDGDTLEEHNLDRQLFNKRDIGKFKAFALLKHNGLLKTFDPVTAYINAGFYTMNQAALDEQYDIIICLVDNHPARKEAIALAQQMNVPVVIGANEYSTSQVMYWHPCWDSHTHPINRYPEIGTETGGSPISCQGVAQESTPQLAMANQVSASLVHLMIYLWKASYNEVDPQAFMPIEYQTTLSKIETVTYGPTNT